MMFTLATVSTTAIQEIMSLVAGAIVEKRMQIWLR